MQQQTSHGSDSASRSISEGTATAPALSSSNSSSIINETRNHDRDGGQGLRRAVIHTANENLSLQHEPPASAMTAELGGERQQDDTVDEGDEVRRQMLTLSGSWWLLPARRQLLNLIPFITAWTAAHCVAPTDSSHASQHIECGCLLSALLLPRRHSTHGC
jgi:hypothetical protein